MRGREKRTKPGEDMGLEFTGVVMHLILERGAWNNELATHLGLGLEDRAAAYRRWNLDRNRLADGKTTGVAMTRKERTVRAALRKQLAEADAVIAAGQILWTSLYTVAERQTYLTYEDVARARHRTRMAGEDGEGR